MATLQAPPFSEMQINLLQLSTYQPATPAERPVASIASRPPEHFSEAPSVEVILNQSLKELQDLKVSQTEAHRKTNKQLGQINTSILHLSTHVSQVEQRISDSEDSNNKHEIEISRIKTELKKLQLKLEEAENRSESSNLRFLGISQDYEAGSTVTKVVSDLIYKNIFPEKTVANTDLTIMQVHRAPG
ncbi:hypothetical protein NDU88_002819 [Pleurodeles waltl]|uniref:Uncharacterized protein n=1 Tax=Pleurodeles waltl TaxID=8319 RepID=A0AAV7W496_PLEWA|nr:hypothetical protein NDU88_002819 [Pleurodeles waltl]